MSGTRARRGGTPSTSSSWTRRTTSRPRARPASPGSAATRWTANRTIATRALAERCEHRLFLSATPHNGYSESFTALMEMIDGRRFKRGASLDERALRDIAVRRLKADLREVKGFQPRELKTLAFTPERGRGGEVRAARPHPHRERAAERAGQVRRHRGDAAEEAVPVQPVVVRPDPAASTPRPIRAAASGPTTRSSTTRRCWAAGSPTRKRATPTHPEFTALRHSKRSDPLSAATSEDIASLIAWGQKYENQPDARLTALLKFLDAVCRPDGTWSNERVVVFTEYAATLDWIVRVLSQRGYREGTELAVIQGSTPAEEREDIRAKFTAPPNKQPVRVLVATDSAGEGIDLQDYCHRLVNFDIPFNPSRLEQRIGRIDRYGQQFTPEIYQLSPPGTARRTCGT